MIVRTVNGREYKTESGVPIKTRLEQVLSEILSDKHDAKITITLKDWEDSEDVPRVQDDTVRSEMSKCS